MPINEASVDWLLYSAPVLPPPALEPHALAEVFGPDGEIASKPSMRYIASCSAPHRRVEMFFKQWDMIFGVIYGQELERVTLPLGSSPSSTGSRASLTSRNSFRRPHLLRPLMKMLAAELISLQEGSWFASFTADIEAAGDDLLKIKVEHLENGGPFQAVQHHQLSRRRLLSVVSRRLGSLHAQNIRHIAISLQQFEPADGDDRP